MARKAAAPVITRESFAPIADLVKIIADPGRLFMLRLLADGTPRSVSEIMNAVGDISQPTISHHLRDLRMAGLVKKEKTGVWSIYTIEPGAVEKLLSSVSAALVA